jgi:hypothetical protein
MRSIVGSPLRSPPDRASVVSANDLTDRHKAVPVFCVVAGEGTG